MNNKLTEQIIGAAIEVHRELGPGLLESIYESCLVYELQQRGLEVEQQVKLPVVYKEHQLNTEYRIDLMVNQEVVVELKTVKVIEPIHEAQLLTYLKLADCRVGLLINFQVPVLKQGIKRLLNGY